MTHSIAIHGECFAHRLQLVRRTHFVFVISTNFGNRVLIGLWCEAGIVRPTTFSELLY